VKPSEITPKKNKEKIKDYFLLFLHLKPNNNQNQLTTLLK